MGKEPMPAAVAPEGFPDQQRLIARLAPIRSGRSKRTWYCRQVDSIAPLPGGWSCALAVPWSSRSRWVCRYAASRWTVSRAAPAARAVAPAR